MSVILVLFLRVSSLFARFHSFLLFLSLSLSSHLLLSLPAFLVFFWPFVKITRRYTGGHSNDRDMQSRDLFWCHSLYVSLFFFFPLPFSPSCV